tara:strand:- start:621 stop:950 length:330 start_codon:yes stop_codon:yes gene_type:complete
MKEITDKMNAIELQTKELLEKAQILENQKVLMTTLMECSQFDHTWEIGNITSTLTEVHQIDVYCTRCGSTANFVANVAHRERGHLVESRPIPIFARTEERLSKLVGEEE